MAYNEFYIAQAGGSDLNAGSTTGAAAVTSTNGDWGSVTANRFTPNGGGTPFSGVSVGDWASIYLDAATTLVYLAQVTAVNGGGATLDFSTTAKYGTAPATGATGRSIKVGGVWATPFAFLGTGTTAVYKSTRINVKAGAYSFGTTTRAFNNTGAAGIPLVWRGYNTTPGDIDTDNSLAKPEWVWGAATVSGTGARQIFININWSSTRQSQIMTAEADMLFVRCRFEALAVNINAMAMAVANAAGGNFYYCSFKAPSLSIRVLSVQAGCLLSHCVINGGQIGMETTGSTPFVLEHCLFVGQGSHAYVGQNAGTRHQILNCTFKNGGGDGIRFNAAPIAGTHIRGNMFDSLVGVGINNATGTNMVGFLADNDFYNCAGGNTSGFGDTPQLFSHTETSNPAVSSSDPTFSGPGFLGASARRDFENYAIVGTYFDLGTTQRQVPQIVLGATMAATSLLFAATVALAVAGDQAVAAAFIGGSSTDLLLLEDSTHLLYEDGTGSLVEAAVGAATTFPPGVALAAGVQAVTTLAIASTLALTVPTVAFPPQTVTGTTLATTATVSAPTVALATASLRWYLTPVTGTGAVEADLAPQAAGTFAYGWTVGTGSTNSSELLTTGVAGDRPSSSFVGNTVPDGTIDTSLGDIIRLEPQTGTFAAGNWTFQFAVVSPTFGGSADGQIVFRLLRGSSSNGAGATEITSAQQTASVVTNVAASPDSNSIATISLSSFTLTSEYLFVQVAWKRTGAGSDPTTNIRLRMGVDATTGTGVLSSAFTGGTQTVGTPQLTSTAEANGAVPYVVTGSAVAQNMTITGLNYCQSIVGHGGLLSSLTMYFQAASSPSGGVYVELHQDTIGGTLLWTSATVTTSVIGASDTAVVFTPAVTLDPSKTYWLEVFRTNATTGTYSVGTSLYGLDGDIYKRGQMTTASGGFYGGGVTDFRFILALPGFALVYDQPLTTSALAPTAQLFAATVAVGPVTVLGATRATTQQLFAPALTSVALGATIGSTSGAFPPSVAQTILGATIPVGGQRFAPSVALTISLATVGATTQLFAPTVLPSGALGGQTVTSTLALFAPTVAAGAVTITGATLASTATLTTPSVTTLTFVTTGTRATTLQVFAPSVSTGPVAVTGQTVGSTAQVFPPSLGAGATPITGAFIPTTAVLYAQQLIARLDGTFIASTALVVPPTVIITQTVTTGTVPVGSLLFAPSVALTITGATRPTTVTLFQPSVAVGPATIAGPTLASGALVFAPSLGAGAVTVVTPGRTTTIALFAPTVSVSLVQLFIGSTAQLFAPSVAAGPVTEQGAHIASTLTLFPPVVAPVVTAPTIPSTSQTFAPTLLPLVETPLWVVSTTLFPPSALPIGEMIGPTIPSGSQVFPPQMVAFAPPAEYHDFVSNLVRETMGVTTVSRLVDEPVILTRTAAVTATLDRAHDASGSLIRRTFVMDVER